MTRSKRDTGTMTHYQLVKENQPKPIYYKGTETKKMARPCMRCGVVVQGTLANLERHVTANHPKVTNGYDYTNQAWIVDGVYAMCFCPEPGTVVDPGRLGGPGGPKYVATLCNCYGRVHEGEPPAVGASIH